MGRGNSNLCLSIKKKCFATDPDLRNEDKLTVDFLFERRSNSCSSCGWSWSTIRWQQLWDRESTFFSVGQAMASFGARTKDNHASFTEQLFQVIALRNNEWYSFVAWLIISLTSWRKVRFPYRVRQDVLHGQSVSIWTDQRHASQPIPETVAPVAPTLLQYSSEAR